MKTSQSLLVPLSLMVAGGWLTSITTGLAAPGGSMGTGTAASAGTGGGHTVSAAPAAGGHSAHATMGIASHPTLSTGSAFHSSAGSANSVGISRAASGVNPAAYTTMGPRTGAAQTGVTRPFVQMPTARNAWTDPSNPRVSGGLSTVARPGSAAYGARTGNNLYPGAYGYVPTRPANGHFQHDPNGNHDGSGHHRHSYYNNFPYAVYYPYLYNNYGYGGIGSYGYYGGGADYSGLTANGDVTDLGAPDFSNTPNNYYSYVQPEQNAPDADASATPDRPLPDAPNVGPQGPASNDKSSASPQGPDSLVEAVQDELSRRGYFAGKPDAMYGPATKEAIRRFQSDQHLPSSGLINEATLHALHLD